MFTKLTRSATLMTLGTASVVLAAGAAPVDAGEEATISTVAAAIEADATLKAMVEDYGSPLFIPAADFRSDGLYPEANFYSTGGYWQGDDLGGVYMMAPVWLPDGAEIDTVALLAVDNDDDCSSPDITWWLQRVDNYTGAVDIMEVVSSYGSWGNHILPWYSGDPPNYPVIDYPGYAYWLTVRLCSTDHKIYGAMIIY